MAAKRSKPANVTAEAVANILFDTIPEQMITRLPKQSEKWYLFKIKLKAHGRVEEDMLIF